MRIQTCRAVLLTCLGVVALRSGVEAAAVGHSPIKPRKAEDSSAILRSERSTKKSQIPDIQSSAKWTGTRLTRRSPNEQPSMRWTRDLSNQGGTPDEEVHASSEGVSAQALSFDYGSQKVRGVNLGGWLVLEPWITPSIFEQFPVESGPVDEYTLTQRLGKDEAFRQLYQHWATWIQEKDFRWIANHKLNHVRIPIGYWAVWLLPGDPYVQGQLEFMDRAIQWAKQYGLKVWIDLHGAPGSQNGFDNSGWRDHKEWQRGVKPNGKSYVRHTIETIRALTKRYAGQEDVVVGIELLNEPLPGPEINMDQVRQYYYDGYYTVREHNPSTAVVMHDAFQDITSWNGYMPAKSYNHVIIDTHHYQVFTPNLVAMSEQEHINAACGFGWNLRNMDKWTVVGEWSGAWTDCAKWLNGYGRGIRYEGSFPGSWPVGQCGAKRVGRVKDLSEQERVRLRRFIEAQLDAYEQGAGWIFWTWKTEGAPEWDMIDLLGAKLFPVDPSDRKYPNQCKFN